MSNRLTKGTGLFGRVIASNGIQVGSSGQADVKGMIYGSLSVVHGTVLPGRLGTVGVVSAGLAVGDAVSANIIDVPAAGLAFAGVQPAAGTLNVFVANVTSGTISPGTFSIGAFRFDLT